MHVELRSEAVPFGYLDFGYSASLVLCSNICNPVLDWHWYSALAPGLLKMSALLCGCFVPHICTPYGGAAAFLACEVFCTQSLQT